MSNTDNFLWNASKLLSALIPSSSASVLQTHVLGKLMRKSDERKPSVRYTACKFCNNMLTNSSRMKIIPKKVIGKSMRRLVQRVQSPNVLFVCKAQQSLLKKFNQHEGNKLVLTCRVCNKKNVHILEKPSKDEQVKLNEQTRTDPHTTKKKKKKKDHLAGLKASAVMAANISESACINKTNGGIVRKKKKVENQSLGKPSESILPSSSISEKAKSSVGGKPGKVPVPSQSKAIANLLSMKNKKKSKKHRTSIAPNCVPLTAVKKFTKGNKLTAMLALAEKEKLAQRKRPKNSLLSSLELMLH